MAVSKKIVLVGVAATAIFAGGYVARNVLLTKAESALLAQLQKVYPNAKITHDSIETIPWQTAVAVNNVVVTMPDENTRWKEWKAQRIESGLPNLSGMPKQIQARGVQLTDRQDRVVYADDALVTPLPAKEGTDNGAFKRLNVRLKKAGVQMVKDHDNARIESLVLHDIDTSKDVISVEQLEAQNIDFYAPKDKKLDFEPVRIEKAEGKNLKFALQTQSLVDFTQLHVQKIHLLDHQENKNFNIDSILATNNTTDHKATFLAEKIVVDNPDLRMSIDKVEGTADGNALSLAEKPYVATVKSSILLEPLSADMKKTWQEEWKKDKVVVDWQINTHASVQNNQTQSKIGWKIDAPTLLGTDGEVSFLFQGILKPDAADAAKMPALQALRVTLNEHGGLQHYVQKLATDTKSTPDATAEQIANEIAGVLQANRLPQTAEQLKKALTALIKEGGAIEWTLTAKDDKQQLQNLFVNGLINPQGTLDGLNSTITHRKSTSEVAL